MTLNTAFGRKDESPADDQTGTPEPVKHEQTAELSESLLAEDPKLIFRPDFYKKKSDSAKFD